MARGLLDRAAATFFPLSFGSAINSIIHFARDVGPITRWLRHSTSGLFEIGPIMARSAWPVETSFLLRTKPILRHALLSVGFIASYLLLSRPEIIFLTRLGFVAWYPAVGLSLALLLGISPWYVVLTGFCDALAGAIFYDQSFKSFTGTIGTLGAATCYATAAYLLRGPLRIDLKWRPLRSALPRWPWTTRYFGVSIGTPY